MCVCLCMHVPVAGPTSSMGVNFISQETSTVLYCGDQFPRDIQCSVSLTGIAVVAPDRGAMVATSVPGLQGSCSLVGDLAPSRAMTKLHVCC